jgi:hypothetical protein
MFGEAKNKTVPKDTEGSTEGTPTADVYRLWLKESSPIVETMERGQDSTEEVMRPPFKLFYEAFDDLAHEKDFVQEPVI